MQHCVCLRTLRGESARLWRDNVKIQLHNLKGSPGLSHYIYLGSKRMCTRSSIHPSILHLLWADEVIFHTNIQLPATQADVFKWLSDSCLRLVPVSELPRWESYGAIGVMKPKGLELRVIPVKTDPCFALRDGCEVTALFCDAKARWFSRT